MHIGQLSLLERHGLHLCWKDVQEALRRGIVTSQEALSFVRWRAEADLGSCPEEQGLRGGLRIQTIVNQLAEKESSLGEDMAARRWRYALLKELVERADAPKDILIAIERLWADFDCPDEMRQLIYYNPPTDGYNPKAHTLEENQKRLLEMAREFLVREYQEIKSVSE